MAALSGTAGSVVYMTGGTTTVVGIAEWSLDIGMTPVEITAFGDNWKVNLPSIREFSGSFSGNSDTDASQASLRNAMLGGSAVALRLYEGSSNYWNIGTAYLTGLGRSISQTGKGESSFDFEGSSTLTYV